MICMTELEQCSNTVLQYVQNDCSPFPIIGNLLRASLQYTLSIRFPFLTSNRWLCWHIYKQWWTQPAQSYRFTWFIGDHWLVCNIVSAHLFACTTKGGFTIYTQASVARFPALRCNERPNLFVCFSSCNAGNRAMLAQSYIVNSPLVVQCKIASLSWWRQACRRSLNIWY